MSYEINLDEVDVDGAVREAADEVAGDTRLSFLKKAGLAGGAVMGGGAVISALAPSAFAASQKGRPPAKFGKGDIGILNYALTLEYLESQFYAKVVAANLFSGKVGGLLKTFGSQEESHVTALKAAVTKLGGTPAEAPKGVFPIHSATQVALLAYTVENLGASAYLGQAAKIQSPEVLASALAIHTVEARHAATLGTLVKRSVTPQGAFAVPADMPTVLAAVKPFLG